MVFLFVYVDYILTSRETQTSRACYGDSFTFLYIDGIRTSYETPAVLKELIWA
jgi:hypothetical protein